MMFYTVHTASCQKPMALAESTVNPWTSSQEDAMHNSLLAVLARELHHFAGHHFAVPTMAKQWHS